MLQLQIKVNLGVMAMKEYSTLPRTPDVKPHHQILFSVIPRIPLYFFDRWGLTSLQKLQCILSATNRAQL